MRILQILGLSKSDKDKKAQERIGRQLKRQQEKLIDDLDAKKDKLLAQKEALESISVETSDSKLESWNSDYQKVTVELALIDKEIEIAGNTLKDLFNEKSK